MTYAERLKAYNEARANVAALEEKKERAEYDLTEIIKRNRWSEDRAEIEAARAIRDAAAEPIPAAKLRAAILRDNARRAFFEEITPAAVEVFKKYERKQYGEKTRRRISDEIHEKTGFFCYISDNGNHSKMQFASGDYRQPWKYDEMELTFYHGRSNDDGPRALLTADNRINMNSADALRPYSLPEYVEDPDAQAEKIRAAHEKALEAWEAWSAAASAYNSLIPNGAHQIDDRAGKPYPIMY